MISNPERPDVIRRKAQLVDEPPPRKLVVDILKSSAIIADNFTGELRLVFNHGGLIGSEVVTRNVL